MSAARRRRSAPPLEQDVTETRVLTVEYMTRHRFRFIIYPGHGGIAGALREAWSNMAGMVNVDPRSIRYTIDENGGVE